jgi:hypothetical protein
VTAEFSPEDRNVLSAQCSVLSKMVTSFLCKDLKKNLGTDLFLSVSNSCHGVGGPLLLWHARNYLLCPNSCAVVWIKIIYNHLFNITTRI